MQIELNHIEYPKLFLLDMQGKKDETSVTFTSTSISANSRKLYSSSNSIIDNTNFAKYGRGPFLGWWTGGASNGILVIGALDNASFSVSLANYTSSAVTPNSSTQFYSMLPLQHVDRVVYPNTTE